MHRTLRIPHFGALAAVLLPLAFAGCIEQSGAPDPGQCANAPDKKLYTWGEVEIGTCLSGPADVAFFEQDGKTYLSVTNANPYLDYSGGSYLVIDWDSIDLSQEINLMHTLDAGALPLDNYVGGIGILSNRRQALVAGRFSEGAAGRSYRDSASIVDLDNPIRPKLWSKQSSIRLRDDPFPIQVDENTGRAYVGNITDHSVSVIDTTGEELSIIDVAPGTIVSTDLLDDVDLSGTVAEFHDVAVLIPEELPDDHWTLTFIDGTARTWIPEAVDDSVGLLRWTDVGYGATPSPMGVEVDPLVFGDLRDASFTFTDTGRLYFTRNDGSEIVRIGNDGQAGDWDTSSEDVELRSGGVDAWDEVLGNPTAITIDNTVVLFYDGRTADGARSIGLALPNGTAFYPNPAIPILDPVDHVGFAEFSAPSLFVDGIHGSVRMWMTATLDDGQQVIGLSQSDNLIDWSPIEIVSEDVATQHSKPTVIQRNGRFQMWYTADDGAAWSHRTAWSYDGRNWVDDALLVESNVPYDALLDAPRVAVQVDNAGAWRIEGRDAGPVDALVSAGVAFINATDGYSLSVTHGQEVSNNVIPDNRAKFALKATSVVEINGIPTVYAGLRDDTRTRIGALQQVAGEWISVGADLIPAGSGGNKAGVSAPVVVPTDSGFTMIYAAVDANNITTLRRATSPDGLHFTSPGGAILKTEDTWDGVEQLAHSVEVLDDGSVRLWYSGNNSSRTRIGSATAPDINGSFTPEVGAFDPWRFESGVPGSFDDGGVKDPLVYTDDDGITHLMYAGFNGQVWQIGHAILDEDGDFQRRVEDVSDISLAAMSGQVLSFSALGVEGPVLWSHADGNVELLYTGIDQFSSSMGRAFGPPERPWATQAFPTAGDTLTFSTTLGKAGKSVIELAQSNQYFTTTGVGMSGMTLDTDRGFLYIPSKLDTHVYIVDVVDNSGGSFDDDNNLDLEGLLLMDALGTTGFRDIIIDNVRDRMYLTSRTPEGVMVVDLNDLTDNAEKENTWNATIGMLPLPPLSQDEGAITFALIGGAGMTLSADSRYLVVTHHRGNGVAVFDLDQGAYGQEVAWLAHVGENPHVVRLSPDGKYAVVANYVGEIDSDDRASSTLAVIDMDPTSETFLEVVTWLANQ